MSSDVTGPATPAPAPDSTAARRHRFRGDSQQPVEAANVPDALLTIHTVGRLYGLSPRTILDKVRAGELPAPLKYTARWLRWPAHVILADLRRLAAGHKKGAPRGASAGEEGAQLDAQDDQAASS